MTMGMQIAEAVRRQGLFSLFSYEEHQRLRRITSVEELRRFLLEAGYDVPEEATSERLVSELVEQLKSRSGGAGTVATTLLTDLLIGILESGG